jgi:hypothetical protein
MLIRITAALISACVILAACGDRNERYAISETGPFYQTKVALDLGRADAVIEAVRSFAKKHQMDVLVVRDSLPPGEFSVEADGPSLNLKAMHVETLGAGVTVFAISRAEPTPQDKALVEDFVALIRSNAAGSRRNLSANY